MIDKTNLDGPSGKLDPDGGFRLQVELVPCEAGQQVGLAHTRVADQNNFEKEIILVYIQYSMCLSMWHWPQSWWCRYLEINR